MQRRFVYAPGIIRWLQMRSNAFIEFRGILQHPSVVCLCRGEAIVEWSASTPRSCIISSKSRTPWGSEATAQSIAAIPPHIGQDDFGQKMPPFEGRSSRHRRARRRVSSCLPYTTRFLRHNRLQSIMTAQVIIQTSERFVSYPTHVATCRTQTISAMLLRHASTQKQRILQPFR
jgi:hypothetical protein